MRIRRRPGLIHAVVLALAAAVIAVPSSAAAVPAAPTGTQTAPTPAADPDQPGRLVPLITGDVIKVTGEGNDANATVAVDADPVGDVTIARHDNDIYAIPGVAAMLLAQGSLDMRLFD